MRWKQGWHHGSGIGIAMLAVALATACAAERAAERPAGLRADAVITMWDDRISPDSLTVRPGETVVWSNLSPESDAQILFAQGKGAFQACAKTVGFIRPAGGDYYTGPVGPGAQASLCIPATGTYEYQVIQYIRGNSTSYGGRIIVK